MRVSTHVAEVAKTSDGLSKGVRTARIVANSATGSARRCGRTETTPVAEVAKTSGGSSSGVRTARILANSATLAAVLVLTGACLGGDWAEPGCDARIPLTVRGDLYTRMQSEMQRVLNFNEILGPDRTLAASSLKLRHAESGDPVPFRIAEDQTLRYPSRNPILRARWSSSQLRPFEDRTFHLYFRTVSPGDAKAWSPLTETFSATDPSVLLSTSFEHPRPSRANSPLEILAWGEDKEGIHTERVWTDETARTGTRGLKIARVIDPGAKGYSNKPFWYMWPPTIEVREGGVYQFGVWVKTTKLPGNHHASVVLNYWDASKRRIAGRNTGHIVARGPRKVSDWTFVHGSLAAPQGGRYVTVNLSLGTQGEVFFDDLSVRAVPGSLVPYPAIVVGLIEERDEIVLKTPKRTDRKRLVCGIAKAPPKLDGVLDDSCWAEAGRVDDLLVHLRPAEHDAPRRTEIRACADRDALYLAFDCEEPDADRIVAKGVGRDGNIWRDDTVEMFLDTNRDGRSFYQIALNAKGTLFDQDTGVPGLPGESWTGPIDVGTKIWQGRWTAEVRIGFVGLRLAEAAGRTWTGNFARTSMRGGQRTLYTWVKIQRNFGEPGIFGDLILPFDATANAVTAQPLPNDAIFSGQGNLPVTVTNRRAEPVRMRLSVTDVGGQQPRSVGQTTLVAEPTSTVEASVPASFPDVGTTRLRLELLELPGERQLYVTSGEYTIPAPLQIRLISGLSYTSETSAGVG